MFPVLHNEGRKTKQDSDQAVLKHKIPISYQHKFFFANFLFVNWFWQPWEEPGSIFKLSKVTDDTLISAQSSPTNTNFQALSNLERKLENIVSSKCVAPKWIGTLNGMGLVSNAKKLMPENRQITKQQMRRWMGFN